MSPTAPAHSLTPAQLHRTFECMAARGGGFVSALAAAWFAADPRNKSRIEDAFPHLLLAYGPDSPYFGAFR